MASSSETSIQNASDDDDRLKRLHALLCAHDENAVTLPPIEEARAVLQNSLRGLLSTFSQKHEGYPSGSMVDFAYGACGSPILLLSTLAVHYKNLLANPKCSLLVAKDPEDKTGLVIIVYGDAVPVADTEKAAVIEAYLERHPDGFWVDLGFFQCLRIEPKVIRYQPGVLTSILGREFSKEALKSAKLDPIYQFSNSISSHMNKDRAEDTKLIVQHSTSLIGFTVDSAHMQDVDSLGFYVKAGYQGSTFKLRISFPRRADDRKDVETLFAGMLQAAKTRN